MWIVYVLAVIGAITVVFLIIGLFTSGSSNLVHRSRGSSGLKGYLPHDYDYHEFHD